MWKILFDRSLTRRNALAVARRNLSRPGLEELEQRLVPSVPTPSHVVLVIEENHSYNEIIGSSSAPYINSLASQGALMTQSFAVEHPSQPNYLDLFSGSNQGVTNDTTPPQGSPYSTPDFGGELIKAGLTFGGFSEDLPSVGYTGSSFNNYVRKHNPWVDFSDVPSTDNLPFSSFPSNFSTLPTVSIVVPNLQDDMHDGTIQQGDTWLKNNIDAYVQWAKTHNSLLIVTWDENDGTQNNQIPTIFVGPMVANGQYAETINHFNVLRTIEDMYGLSHAGASATAAPISDIWASTATPPTISSISAGPNSVVATTTALSATATDPNPGATITSYTWSVLNGPSGVTFDSNNGKSTGNNVTATFTQAGSYTFQVTVADSLGASNTTTVAVTVQQTLTHVTVTPANAEVPDGTTKQFTATALDQFGNALTTQPSFSWSLAAGAAGTIDPASGIYTAPASGVGADTVRATTGGVTGTTAVTHAQPPTVTQPASAVLSSTGTTANLSALATDPNPNASITKYTWSVSGPSGVTFSSNNGTSTGNNATATFTQIGTYNFTVTVTDSLGLTSTSTVNLGVGQVLTTISISPSSATVHSGRTMQFTASALDQFNNAMTVPISWMIVSGPSNGMGTISSSGLYTAPTHENGTVTIEAFDGSVFGTATITLRKH
jgi:hypothetical protein